MKFSYPIEQRTTKDLIEIIEREGDWLPEVVAAAKQELVKRGENLEELQRKINTRHLHEQKITQIKANASYKAWQIILIVLFAPLLFVLKLFYGDIFDLSHDGFIKKSRQRFWFTILGLVLWFIFACCFYHRI